MNYLFLTSASYQTCGLCPGSVGWLMVSWLQCLWQRWVEPLWQDWMLALPTILTQKWLTAGFHLICLLSPPLGRTFLKTLLLCSLIIGEIKCENGYSQVPKYYCSVKSSNRHSNILILRNMRNKLCFLLGSLIPGSTLIRYSRARSFLL